jgi:hypothetical protein
MENRVTSRDQSGPIGWPTRSVTESQSNILYQVVTLVRHQSGNRVGSGFVVEGSTSASRARTTRGQASGSDPITRLVADDCHKALRIEDLWNGHRLACRSRKPRSGADTRPVARAGPCGGRGLVRPGAEVAGHVRRAGRGVALHGPEADWYGRHGPRTTGAPARTAAGGDGRRAAAPPSGWRSTWPATTPWPRPSTPGLSAARTTRRPEPVAASPLIPLGTR